MRFLVVQHEEKAGLGSFAGVFAERGVEVDVWRPSAGEPLPRPLEVYDGVVSLGSFAEPDRPDAHPWLDDVVAVSRRAVAERVPLLGVCLGAQMLAGAAGAEVGPVGRPAFGWEALEVTPEAEGDPLFGDLAPDARALVWQQFGFRAPAAAALLARTEAADQAFRLGERAWAVQYHPEVDADELRRWAEASGDELDEAGIDRERLLAESERRLPGYVEAARALAHRFVDEAARGA